VRRRERERKGSEQEAWAPSAPACALNHSLSLSSPLGIGPEIAEAVKAIFAAAGVPVTWDEQTIGTAVDPATNSLVSRANLDSVLTHRIGLKGPMATPIGKGHRSLNLTLRKELQLYANVRPCFSIPGYKTRYDGVNLVTIRENTEGEYSGLEHEVVPGVVESLKVITRAASTRVAQYAFKYARDNGRARVTAIHKANIMKLADGKSGERVAWRRERERRRGERSGRGAATLARARTLKPPFSPSVFPLLPRPLHQVLPGGVRVLPGHRVRRDDRGQRVHAARPRPGPL